MKVIFTTFLLSLITITFTIGQNSEKIYLWPDNVPNETNAKHAPTITTDSISNVTKVTNVSNPCFEVFTPEKSKNNGAGIIVCPGGSYKFLAIDLEGYEVAEWLNKLGYTAFVLQYRVPHNRDGALCDIQRAMRIIRSKSEKWNLNPDKIGVLGFSAGGSLCARISTRYKIDSYNKIDNTDTVSCRPDFTVLIYPAYLAKGPYSSLTPEITLSKDTPPMFVFSTADDGAGGSALAITAAMRKNKLPVELHMLPEGGHGYGLRPGNMAAETWPFYAEYWLKKNVLKKHKTKK